MLLQIEINNSFVKWIETSLATLYQKNTSNDILQIINFLNRYPGLKQMLSIQLTHYLFGNKIAYLQMRIVPSSPWFTVNHHTRVGIFNKNFTGWNHEELFTWNINSFQGKYTYIFVKTPINPLLLSKYKIIKPTYLELNF